MPSRVQLMTRFCAVGQVQQSIFVAIMTQSRGDAVRFGKTSPVATSVRPRRRADFANQRVCRNPASSSLSFEVEGKGSRKCWRRWRDINKAECEIQGGGPVQWKPRAEPETQWD